MTYSKRGLLFGLAVVVSTGCFKVPSADNPDIMFQCTRNSHCADGYACADDICVKKSDIECTSDSECTAPEVCTRGKCADPSSTACTDSLDCTEPPACKTSDAATCDQGVCSYPDVVCNTPDPDECISGNSIFRTYATTGTCVPESNICVYAPTDTNCPNCDTDCMGPCAGVTCPDLNRGCRTNGTCVPATASCSYSDASNGILCDFDGIPPSDDGICSAGTCIEPSNQSCAANNECTPDTCIDLFCRPISGLNANCDSGDAADCLANMSCPCPGGPPCTCVNNDGESCIQNADCLHTCLAGTCAPEGQLQETCDTNPDDDADCSGALLCSGGECLHDDGASCDANDECVNTCTEDFCAALAAAGEPCDAGDDADCIANHVCRNQECVADDTVSCSDNATCLNTCIAGACAPISAAGGSCDAGDSEDCIATADCIGTTCLLADGQGCLDNAECANTCYLATCTGLALNGQPCDPGDNDDCVAANACIGGFCRLITGETCTNNTQCAATCIGALCGPPVGAGGTCDTDDSGDCAADTTCVGTTCLSDDGQVCTDNGDCVNACIELLCAPLATTGGTCDTDDTADCAANHTCVGTSCLGNDTVSCGANGDCVNTCIGGACAAAAGFSGTCDTDDSGDCGTSLGCVGETCLWIDAEACAGNSDCVNTCIAGSCAALSPYLGLCDTGDSADCGINLQCPVNQCLRQNGQGCAGNAECANTCLAFSCADRSGLAGSCDTGPDDNGDCNTGLECSGGACVVGGGGACSVNGDCGADTCIGGVCTPLSAWGGICDPGDSADCAVNLTCDAANVCKNSIGRPCPDNNVCADTCIGNLCALPAGTSGTCDSGDTGDCVANHTCIGTACRLNDTEGCGANADCVNTCIGGTCAPPAPTGGTCDNSDTADCVANRTCVGTTCLADDTVACSANSDCVNTCIGGFCAPAAGTGGTCDTSDTADCVTDHSCIITTCLRDDSQGCAGNGQCVNTCIANTCQPRSGATQPCDTADNGDCIDASYTCVVTTCLLNNGENCAGNNECVNACIGPTCSARAGNGGTCDTDDSDDCTTGRTCIGTSCLGNDTVSCGANGDCVNTCIGLVCATASTGGQPCDSGNQGDCATDYTCTGTTCFGDNGAACGTNSECTNTCIGAVCAPPATTNQTCDASDTGDCVVNHTCIGIQCLRNNGLGCASNGQCVAACIGTACAPFAGTNGTCDTDDTPDCVANHACIGVECLRVNGQSCTNNTECANTCIGGTCLSQAAYQGTCDPGDSGDCIPGTTCAGTTCLRSDGQGCAGNAECANTCISSLCRPLSGATDPCDSGDDADCLNSNYTCVGTTCLLDDGQSCAANGDCVNTCISGTCAPPAGYGLTCDPGDQADCGLNLGCVGTTCLRDDGQACGGNGECINTCISSLCSPVVGFTEACDTGDNADCGVDLECPAGTCVWVDGESCSANNECVNTCISNRCEPLSASTEPCDTGPDDDEDCGPGLVCSSGSCVATGGSCSLNTECLETCISGVCANYSNYGQICDSGDSADCSANLVCPGTTCLWDDGQSCTANSQCANTCIGPTCAPVSTNGNPCDAGDNADCGAGMVCSGLQCLGPSGTGYACTANSQCVDTCIGGFCAARASTNGTCDPADTPDCQANHTCVGTECLRNNSQPCSANSDCANTCIATSCADLSGVSDPCDTADTADCIANHTCIGTTCLRDDGQVCSGNAQCVNTCIGPNCAPNAGTGGTCDTNDTADCIANHTCVGVACLRDDAQACTNNNQCVNTCITNLCSVPSSAGGDCDSGDQADCDAFSTCTGTRCLGENGQTCALNAECLNTCIANLCADIATNLGDPCDNGDDADCAGTYTCTYGTCAPGDCGCNCGSPPCNATLTSDSCISGYSARCQGCSVDSGCSANCVQDNFPGCLCEDPGTCGCGGCSGVTPCSPRNIVNNCSTGFQPSGCGGCVDDGCGWCVTSGSSTCTCIPL